MTQAEPQEPRGGWISTTCNHTAFKTV